MRFRTPIVICAAVAASGLCIYTLQKDSALAPAPLVVAVKTKPDAALAADPDTEGEERGPALHPPTGKLASLSCAAAATIMREVRAELAFAPVTPTNAEMAAATKDWIDPHGHWAVARDAAPFAAIDTEANALLTEATRGTSCAASVRVGAKLASWVGTQRARYDRRAASAVGEESHALVDALDVVSRDAAPSSANVEAAALTDELGDRAGALEHAFGAPIAPYLQTARNRFFPEMTADAWSEVVLAAVVRGWVEQVDAHGAWAPYGEESTVHDVDLDEDAPARLWTHATRTLLGVRIDDGATAPLAAGDVLLEVNGMALAGLPVEQLDELALTAGDVGEPYDVVLMHIGDRAPRSVRVDPDAPVAPSSTATVASAHPFDLAYETIPYGTGEIALVTITDVYDDLGELFARALARARTPSLVGVVFDLRGDGGGSTQGAIDTLGAFLPGARLFPMRNRRGEIETDRAPSPPTDEQWTGPVATLIDAGTASAAEMLAGALAAYKRGPSVGTPTYGKGCAQEYLDDDAHAGLLRVTTLLFSLPDGSPVQRVGLTPTIAFPFHADDVSSDDREAKLAHSPDSWTGPDVRDHAWLAKSAQFAWPASTGHIGPCKDADVCKALALLEPRGRGPTASRATQR